MDGRGWTLFDTALGRCGILWGPRGILALQLPEQTDHGTRARLLRRAPGAEETAPPAAVRAVIDGVVALLAGAPSDLRGAVLDLEHVPAFHRRAYAVARSIAPGETRTYGELAARLGEPGAAQAVGQAMSRNPFVLVVPCHRVLAADGALGGFSARGGVATKRRLLELEGALPAPALSLF